MISLLPHSTDCPTRERFGYGGDVIASAATVMYMFDMAAFYRKRVADFSSSVRSNGGFTETAPFVGIADASLGGGAGPIDWATVQPYLQVMLQKNFIAQQPTFFADAVDVMVWR
jgi:alpha-L-rhamnosidase